jgi:hypothetical protein
LKFETVVGETDVFRQARFDGGMHQIMRDVGEVGAFGLQQFDSFEGLFDGGVSGVRVVAQGVEKEYVEIGEQREAFNRYTAVICEVGAAAEAEAIDSAFAVVDAHRGEGDASDVERFCIKHVRGEARAAGFAGSLAEDIGEGVDDTGEGFGGGVEGDVVVLEEVEGANVVETKDVIGVGVGIKDGIEVVESGAEGLVAQVRRGVNEDAGGAELEQDRGAEAFVAWVGRVAHLARAADHGNAYAGAGAENEDGGPVELRLYATQFWSLCRRRQ